MKWECPRCKGWSSKAISKVCEECRNNEKNAAKAKARAERAERSDPPDFLRAVRNRFGPLLKAPYWTHDGGVSTFHDDPFDFAWDLAANHDNHVVDNYYTEEDDSLIQPWHTIEGYSWLNPPYANLADWTSKAVLESNKGASLFMLVPASTGSNWWRDYVDRKCWCLFLNGRLTFVGHTSPYPKDLALLLYDSPFLGTRSHYSVWNWRKNL